MDPGEELAGARGFHACSLPRAHASRSFSAGGAPSACLTPLMLLPLAAPLLITSESCFGVPPAMGVSHHPWRVLCPPPLPSTLLLCGERSPSTCLPCALRLNTHKTHTPPCCITPLEWDTKLHTGFLAHLWVTRLPEHLRSPPPGEESHRLPFLGAWASPGSVLGEGNPPPQAA